MKKKKLKVPRRGKPRRRVTPVWRRRTVVLGALALFTLSATGGGWWLWRDGWVNRMAEKAGQAALASSVRLGFRVDEVLVVGRLETSAKDLLDAMPFTRGAAILALDLGEAKRRVEALPWVRRATVERMLPSTVLINVEERRPLALWQRGGKFVLIDNEGEVIGHTRPRRYADLLVVVGEDAPLHAAKFLDILATQPQLLALVKAAVRVGGRRWNVQLEGGVDVRLPEEDPLSAWARLAEYDRTHELLARDVKMLDLRLPDRLTVRRAKPGAGAAAGGRET